MVHIDGNGVDGWSLILDTFLLLHATVLEPDLDLSVVQAGSVEQLLALLLSHVFHAAESLLKEVGLVAMVGLPALLAAHARHVA